MISVAQAQELIRARATPLAAETVPLAAAHDRVLREPAAAAEDVPPFDRSAMDGYAMLADDSARAAKVIGEIRAGETIDAELQPGEAMRIFTGARLPGPGLRVIMQEDVEAVEGRIRLTRISPDRHIRHRGEDARAGEVLLQPGTRLDATAVSVLASVGKANVLVARAPRVLHVTTGDEVVPPGQPLQPGQIRNSNASLITGLCREWSAGTVTHLHAPDRLDALIEIVTTADPKSYDMILVSGGSGGGKYDFTGELFRSLEAEIHFRQVDVRPGKPLIFGTTGERLIFGLPGNALSHFVCFHLFVRTALTALLARAPAAAASATVAEAMPATRNSRETWWPVKTSFHEGRVEVCALRWKSSGDITRLPGADALICVPAGTPELPVGSRVTYLSVRSDF